MPVEGGLKLVKYLVFFFNFIFWLCGIALIVIGILVQVSLHNTLNIKDVSASGAPILLIAHGVIIFVIAFFGCCGAWKESFWMMTLYTPHIPMRKFRLASDSSRQSKLQPTTQPAPLPMQFAVLMSMVIIAEIAAAILGYIYRDKVTAVVKDSLADMISNYNTSSAEFRNAVDKLQQDLKCCGVNSSADWRSSTPEENTVPDSCCISLSPCCGQGAMSDASKVFQRGCQEAVDTLLKANMQWLIAAARVVAFLQVLGVVFACLLMRGIRSG